MKKYFKQIFILFLLCYILTGCATVFGGQRTAYQTTKPNKAKGEPSRELRGGALIADILLTGAVGTIIDFATCAIYKPQPTKSKATAIK